MIQQTHRPLSKAKLYELVARFNLDFPVGTGEVTTMVRGPATVLHGHSAVAWFTGVSGAYSIEDHRVRRAPPEIAATLQQFPTGSSSL